MPHNSPKAVTRLLRSLNPDWLEWAKIEICRGAGLNEDDILLLFSEDAPSGQYFLRLVYVAQDLYQYCNRSGVLLQHGLYDIVRKVFDYFNVGSPEIAEDYITGSLRYGYLEKVGSNMARLSFKGRRVLRTIPGFNEPPPIIFQKSEKEQSNKINIAANISSKKNITHPSGFDRPSIATKISDITEAMNWGRSERATSKANRFIKNHPGFATSATPFDYPMGYYWINLDHPQAPQFPEDPARKSNKKKK